MEKSASESGSDDSWVAVSSNPNQNPDFSDDDNRTQVHTNGRGSDVGDVNVEATTAPNAEDAGVSLDRMRDAYEQRLLDLSDEAATLHSMLIEKDKVIAQLNSELDAREARLGQAQQELQTQQELQARQELKAQEELEAQQALHTQLQLKTQQELKTQQDLHARQEAQAQQELQDLQDLYTHQELQAQQDRQDQQEMQNRPCEACRELEQQVAALTAALAVTQETNARQVAQLMEHAHCVDRYEELSGTVQWLKSENTAAVVACRDANDALASATATIAALRARAPPSEPCAPGVMPKPVKVFAKSADASFACVTTMPCSECSVTLTLANWYRCHSCENVNYCRRCFVHVASAHASGNHAFTNMQVFAPEIADNPSLHRGVIYSIGNHRCDACDVALYPHKNMWYRCNGCQDYDLCSDCLQSHCRTHHAVAHSFTDMSCLVRTPEGFPTIINSWRRPVGAPVLKFIACSGCGVQCKDGRCFRCNTCKRFNLCYGCVITSAWHTHSGMVQHSFSNTALL